MKKGADIICAPSHSTQNSALDITRWVYDNPTGLLKNKLYSDGHGPSYDYEADGRLATRTWARGIITDYLYDFSGSLTNVVYNDTTPDVAYTYDRLGRQLTAISPVSTNTFVYSPATLELDYEIQNGAKIDRSSDTLGRSSGFTLYNLADPVNPVQNVSYSYNNQGQFSSVSSAHSVVTNEYDYSYLSGTDMIQSMTTDSGFAWSRSYEPSRNLISAMSNTWNNTLISSCDFNNDELGRRTLRNDYYINRGSTKVNAFGYNIFSEVTNAVMGTGTYSYDYDPIGNRNQEVKNAVATGYEANGLNQYTNITGGMVAAPTYDLDGNMTFLPSTSGGGAGGEGWHCQWDAENRLIVLSNLTTAVVSSYIYDHQSRRISKTVLNSSLITQHSSFTYDGWNLIGELKDDQSSISTNLYVWGLDVSGSLQGAGGVGGLLDAIVNFTSHKAAYVNNFNVSEMIAQDGSIAAHYEYDPFGNTTLAQGPMAATFPFHYSTKYTDPESGFLYYGFRYLEPPTGRWLSRDPIEEIGGFNLYAFVENNCNLIDVLGLKDNPLIEVGTLEGAIYELKTMENRPHTEIYAFEDEKVSGSVQRGSGFQSCALCPTEPHTVYPCMASGTWERRTPMSTIRLPLWLGQFESTVTDEDRAIWEKVLRAVEGHEQGHVNITETYLNMLNWSYSAVAISCTSYATACATAESKLAKEYMRHFNGITTMHRWAQDTYQKKDVPETWAEIDEIISGE